MNGNGKGLIKIDLGKEVKERLEEIVRRGRSGSFSILKVTRLQGLEPRLKNNKKRLVSSSHQSPRHF
ncbi:hypothetical protein AUJ42_00030 [Candidatus Collierbacteria bacterium CG1_02_44_10]|uniref:Uncharacterized protein n=1 Tax=Candidatus Collierbacteria bacterium CG1_02_44_10 TaxID=1805087 RepID=A0A1J4S0A7_9BACT|nr:MAG: hypothetical protein AUJ42_00030 [Candidatus Collierbacteria bacterium CG1_02_44_10]